MFNEPHDRADEERRIVENGPLCPELVEAIGNRADVDFFLCYSYRYYTGVKGALAAGERAILVPTAEEDDAIRLSVFADLFRAVRGFLYLTPEEKDLIERAAGRPLDRAIAGDRQRSQRSDRGSRAVAEDGRARLVCPLRRSHRPQQRCRHTVPLLPLARGGVARLSAPLARRPSRARHSLSPQNPPSRLRLR